MFKTLALALLAGFFVAPAISSFQQGKVSTSLKDEPESVLKANQNWDEEIIDDKNWTITRVYNDTRYAPKLNQSFAAPNGYAFYLSIDDATLNRIGNEIRLVPELQTEVFSIFFGYSFMGNEIDAITPVQYNQQQIEDYGFEDSVEGIKECIRSCINGYTVLKSSGIEESSEVNTTVTLSFSGQDYHLYQLELHCNVIAVDPFDTQDFVVISANYSMSKNEVLVNSNPVLGFFDSYSIPNPYGFVTDELIYKEPSIADASVKAFMGSDRGNAKKLFQFKARVKELLTGDNKVGGMILTNSNDLNQESDEFVVVGSTANRQTITWDSEQGKYSFNNPNDFNTNPITKDIAAGDVVEVRMFRDDTYSSDIGVRTIRGQGYIISVGSSAEQIVDNNPPIPDDFNLWTCKYEHTIIGDDSSVIASFNDTLHSGITIDNPREGLTLQAKISFVSGGKEYTYYSRSITIESPGFGIKIDGYLNRDTVQRDSEHNCEFFMGKFDGREFDLTQNSRLRVYLQPVRLMDKERGHEIYEDNPQLPETGVVGDYYYLPSDHEIELYKAGEDLSDLPAEGRYYIYTEENTFESFNNGLAVFYETMNRYEYNPDFNKANFSLRYVGKWRFNIDDARFCYKGIIYEYTNHLGGSIYQPIEVVLPNDGSETINLNVEDQINLVMGGKNLPIIPTLSNSEDEVYYFDWSTNRNGIIDFTEREDGMITVEPLRAGLVELTVSAESKYLAKISKTIHIRVLDNIYGATKLVAPEGFHKVGEEVTIDVDIRGITNFANMDVNWKIVDKKNVELSPSLYRVNQNASLTITNPPYGDYKVIATYDSVEIGSMSLEFRYIDMNVFLMNNIWWIALITAGTVVLILLLKKATTRGRTAVQHIDSVYTTLCTYLSDDKLSKHELKKTKRAITSCVHRCEDINIEASNQYEKAIRYLKKSLADSKVLLTKWETVDETEKSIYIDRLDKDLYKALIVAKEIETARDLSDEYHFKANKHNYETVEEPKKKGKKDKEKQ